MLSCNPCISDIELGIWCRQSALPYTPITSTLQCNKSQSNFLVRAVGEPRSARRFEGVNTMVVVVANRAVEMRDGAGLNLLGRISHMIGDVRMYMHRRRVQKRLEALDDRMLADIGLHRGDIAAHVWGR